VSGVELSAVFDAQINAESRAGFDLHKDFNLYFLSAAVNAVGLGRRGGG